MKTTTTSATALASAANVHALVKEAFDAVGAGFERFCLMAGIESLTQMLGEDVDTLAGGRYESTVQTSLATDGVIKAYKQLPILKQALIDHREKAKLDQLKDAA